MNRISAVTIVAAAAALVTTAVRADDLQEIVVTAQKREQRLEDVGISITALGAADLKNNQVQVAEDIVKLVPSLQYNAYSPGTVVFNIRGISQNDYGDQQEPPIAVYYDDSYASSINLSSFPVFDLQRVEVLRGPQGTLFGRNATGGAVQYITNKPTEDFQSYLTVTGGSFREFDIEGAISGSLAPHLQNRFAFQRSSNEGPTEDIYDGSRRGGQDNYALRDEIATQFGDTGKALLTLRYARNLHENNAGVYSWVGDYPGASGLGYYATPTTPSPFGTCDGCDLSGYSNYGINPRFGGNPWKVALNRPSDFDRTLRGAALRVEADAWGLNWVSISDFLNMSKTDLEDGDGGPNTSFNTDLLNHTNQFTEEARVSAKSGIHDWVAGAYYMRVNGHYSSVADFASFGDYVTMDVWQQTTKSVALFAQDEIAFSPAWSLILGGRYWHDRRTFDLNIQDNFGSDFDFNPVTFADLADRSFNNYSAKAEIDRKFADGTLVYLSWNRGTKSGGFTAQFTPPADLSPDGIANYARGLTYNPEILSAYELGLKTRLFNDRVSLNADAFFYDYQNYQAYVLYGASTTIKNLNAREHGVELEINARPVDHLTLSAGVSSLRSRVENVALPDGTLASNQLPQAPAWSGHVLARYEVIIPNGSAIAGQWLTTYTGRTCFTVLCAPVDNEAGHAVSEARLSYQTAGNMWEIAAFVKNVTNRTYRVFNSDTNFIGAAESIYAPPRWYGVTATLKLGAWKN